MSVLVINSTQKAKYMLEQSSRHSDLRNYGTEEKQILLSGTVCLARYMRVRVGTVFTGYCLSLADVTYCFLLLTDSMLEHLFHELHQAEVGYATARAISKFIFVSISTVLTDL